MTRLVAVLVVSVIAYGSSHVPSADLEGVELQVEELTDSTGYFLYSYSLTNPPASTWAIGRVIVDIGATSGTPANLAVTGDIRDWTTSSGAAHAEVGPITPSGWRAALTDQAELWWSPKGGTGLFTPDSVAPGDTMSGFGIRSSYLPGISTVTASPTIQSCCSVPDTATGAFPGLSTFQVSGSTIAPRYMPSEVDLDLLESQANAVCTDPLWITDSSLCTDLSDILADGQARLAVNNYWGARAVLDSIYYWLLDRQGQPSLHDNAFWMLFWNNEVVYDDLGGHGSPGESVLCAHGPANTTAYFTITSTGDSLVATSPHSIAAEVPEVDPEGSSCGTIWNFPLFGSELVDVSVKLDSLTAGRELEEIYIFGYPASGDTTIAAPQDSILISHDGATVSHITYHLKVSGSQ